MNLFDEIDTNLPFEMPQFPGVTAHTLAPYKWLKERHIVNAYVLNQFSIYRDTPIISDRVLNETALSVHLVNKWYLKSPQISNLNCNSMQLKMCVHHIVGEEVDYPYQTKSWLLAGMGNWRECMNPKYGICKE